MTQRPITRRRWMRLSAAGMSLASALRAARPQPNGDVPPLPGLYPGKVVAVEHQNSLVQGVFQPDPIRRMFDAGIVRLTQAPNPRDAWKRFFRPGDTVGIKMVPNGAPWVCSSREVLNEILLALNAGVGIPLANIIVYDRYGDELYAAGIPTWLPPGVRTAWGSDRYTEDQSIVSGEDAIGVKHYYDPSEFFQLALPSQNSPFSNASLFATSVNKIINVACLKDHAAAGVTLCLKSLSHGLFNNVNRSHPGTATYINDFIPQAVSQAAVRSKVVLNILDGIRGIYNGGPFSTGSGRENYLWEHKTLFFATDSVAADRIGWHLIDEKRNSVGLPRTTDAGANLYSGFLDRQPEHIEIAGQLGLGEWRLQNIDYTRVDITNQSGKGKK